MILAVGLTPAWQQIVVLDRLRLGEVNRAQAVHWCASGKVLNVALALNCLGAKTKAITILGGLTGAAIKAEFEHLGITNSWIESRVPTRVCTTILDGDARMTTELVENARAINQTDLRIFRRTLSMAAVNADIIVLSGSIPPGAPANIYQSTLADFSGRLILDLRGPELLQTLKCRPFVAKPNRDELSVTLRRKLRTEKDVIAAMREINRRGAEWVVVTSGPGTVLVTNSRETIRLRPIPAARVVNPIGCGDCVAAGMAWALGKGEPFLEAVRTGMAAATDNLDDLLPARLDRKRVQLLASQIEIRKNR